MSSELQAAAQKRSRPGGGWKLLGVDGQPLRRDEHVRPMVFAGGGHWSVEYPPEKLAVWRKIIRARNGKKRLTDEQCDRIIEGIWPHVRERWWRRAIEARVVAAKTYHSLGGS